VLLLLHVRTHLKKRKIKFAPVIRMVVVTRRFVTFGHSDEKTAAGEATDKFEEVLVHANITHLFGFCSLGE